MRQDLAEAIALQALSYILENHEHCGRFLATTGHDAESLKALTGSAEYLGGVLDYLLSNETLLLAFTVDNDLAPEVPSQARQALPGHSEPR